MQVHRGLVFWGLTLITAGAVALAIQADAIDAGAAREAWRFWPVALIAIGLAVIAARTPLALVATLVAAGVVGGLAGTLVAGWPAGLSIGCGGEPTEFVAADGSFISERADVELRLNCGELDLSTAVGSAWSVEARHGSDARPRIRHDGGSLSVTVEDGGFVGLGSTRQAWEVVLPTDVDLDLDLGTNAASSRLDLGDATLTRFRLNANAGDVHLELGGAHVDDLAVDANAGSISITVDATTRLSGRVDMNAGSLELCAPDSASVAIVLDDASITFSHDLDERGFTREGDTWRRGSGATAISLAVNGNAASLSYNPDGGCS
jgi:hypothetical protein